MGTATLPKKGGRGPKRATYGSVAMVAGAFRLR